MLQKWQLTLVVKNTKYLSARFSIYFRTWQKHQLKAAGKKFAVLGYDDAQKISV